MTTRKFSVVCMVDENNCYVKQVDHNTFDQIRKMKSTGESDRKIIESLTKLNVTEDNFIINGATKDEAIDYASRSGENYVILNDF